MGPILERLLNHLMQNGRVLREAPLVFVTALVAALVIAFGLSYWIVDLRYQGVLDQKTSTIEGLKTQVSELQDRIKGLEQQLVSRQETGRSPSAAASARDPDGLYQLNEEVGSVGPANIDQGNGVVTFHGVRSAGKLDPTREVEYRNFILRCEGLPMAPRPGTFSGSVSSVSTGAQCKIVGQR
jgi:hypothetical protein